MSTLFENTFLMAQAFGALALFVNIYAMQIEKSRNIILAMVPVGVLNTIQFLLLGAWPAAIYCALSSSKDLCLFFVKDKWVVYLIATFLIVVIGFGVYSFDRFYDLFPVLSGIIVNLSLIFRDNRSVVMRATILFHMIWFLYNCTVGAYVGAFSSIIILCSVLVGMFKYEQWEIGKCYRTFLPSIRRSLFDFTPRTYP